MSSTNCTVYTLVYWRSLSVSLIFFGENSAFVHSAAAIANHNNLAFFIPAGTHHYEWEEGAWNYFILFNQQQL